MRTDQDQFEELQVTEFEYTDILSSSDISSVNSQKSEMQMRATEIDELLNLLAIFTRQQRRAVAPAISASSTDINLVRPHTELPPPSRYTRRSRAAGPRQIAN